MRKITFFAALFISILFAACQNSDLELAQVENLTNGEQVTPLRETFDFTYKGESYSSPFYMENDTLMILEDEKVAAVYDRIQELPELATYVAPNGDIEYYDSYEELEINKQSKGLKNKNAISRSFGYSYEIYIYEHADYNTQRQGRKVLLNSPVAIPHLKAYAMDDMISSFTAGARNLIYSARGGITFFRNPDYKAQSITFTINGIISEESGYRYYCKVSNFNSYKVKKGINWNDRILSIKTFE